MGGLDLTTLIERGGIVMWPLMVASVLGVAIILERLVVFILWAQSFRSVVRALEPLVRRGAWRQALAASVSAGPYTKIAHVYLSQRDETKEVRDDVVRREGTLIVAVLENRLRWLATLAQVGTLLGLLGTFYFMIYRFSPEKTATGQIPQAEFYTAIWESFLSTMFGLVVAIPCTTAYQLFEARVDRVARNLEILVSYLDEWCRVADKASRLEDDRESSAHKEKPRAAGRSAV